jgi:hypothetical protein
MANKVDVTLRMTAEDLAFLADALRFVKGGIGEENETRCSFWQMTFERALEEYFEPVEDADEDAGSPPEERRLLRELGELDKESSGS